MYKEEYDKKYKVKFRVKANDLKNKCYKWVYGESYERLIKFDHNGSLFFETLEIKSGDKWVSLKDINKNMVQL